MRELEDAYKSGDVTKEEVIWVSVGTLTKLDISNNKKIREFLLDFNIWKKK